MTVALVVAFLCLILTNHIWLALGLVWVTGGAVMAWELWRSPLMPPDDEERDR